MARTKKQTETAPVAPTLTRAEKKEAVKSIIRELLAVKPYKHNELIEEAAKLYTARFGGEDSVNDVNGRIGSVLDIMKKESDVAYDGGAYALKARSLPASPVEEEVKAEEKPAKKTTKAKAKKEAKPVEETPKTEIPKEEKTVKTKTKKSRAKAEEPAPAPVEETPVPAEEKLAEKAEEKPVPVEEKPAPKKRAGKSKTKAEKTEQKQEKTAKAEEAKPIENTGEKPVEKAEETPVEEAKEEKTEEVKNSPVLKEKGEVAKQNVVMDMSFLFGEVKPQKTAPKAEEKNLKEPMKPTEKSEEKPLKEPAKPTEKSEEKPAQKTEEKPAPQLTVKTGDGKRLNVRTVRKTVEKPLTADERLRENFLKRIRSLGGDYFEYYSVYLLERYSMRNGRRLEGLRISGGERDGGIDGEIELTDKLGFKETIYIQAKNWNPEKGDEKLWVVGETLLQQFIGACACKQAKEGKQHCRGIFITTSRFTPEVKRILDTMSDKIVGYDGADLFEAAKECEFGLIKRGNEWALDERLLSGSKAFFNMV